MLLVNIDMYIFFLSFWLQYDVFFFVHFRDIAYDAFVRSCAKPMCFLIVIRRPGCPFCREEARILDEHRDLIEKEMVRKSFSTKRQPPSSVQDLFTNTHENDIT